MACGYGLDVVGVSVTAVVRDKIAESLEPEVTADLLGTNERPGPGRPAAWVYSGNETPAANAFEHQAFLTVEIRTTSYGDLLMLEERLGWLDGWVVSADDDGSHLAIRYRSPTVNRGREMAGWVSTMIYPVYYAKAVRLGAV